MFEPSQEKLQAMIASAMERFDADREQALRKEAQDNMITNLNPTTDGSPVIDLTNATIAEVLNMMAPDDITALFMQVAKEHDFGGWACPEEGGMYAGVDAHDVTAALEQLSGPAEEAGLDIPWRKAMLIVAATWEYDCYTAGEP